MSKHAHPVPRGVYECPRLYKLLDEARACPIVWIFAPAGSGKTTLVASYLKAKKLPSFWYQMDQSDSDPASFFYCMGEGMKGVWAKKKSAMPLLTPEYRAAMPVFAANYFEMLFKQLKKPGVLVFDNCQDAMSSGTLHEILLSGLEKIPNGITVVVISREQPPLVFAPHRARKRLHVIGWEQMRLTEKESIDIVRLRDKNKRLSDPMLKTFHQQTQGWVAGLVLLTERISG